MGRQWRIHDLSTPVSLNLHVSFPDPCSLLSLTREGCGSDYMELACGPSDSQGDPFSRVLSLCCPQRIGLWG